MATADLPPRAVPAHSLGQQLQAFVRACSNWDPARQIESDGRVAVPLRCRRQVVGYLRPQLLGLLAPPLRAVGDPVTGEPTAVELQHDGDAAAATAALAELMAAWRRMALTAPLASGSASPLTAAVPTADQPTVDARLLSPLRGWRDEPCSLVDADGRHLLSIERAARPLFGVRCYGIHVNGIVRGRDGVTRMWIATRALTKPTWPGRLDNMVGGGIPAASTPRTTMVREAAEEAGLAPAVAIRARYAGSIGLARYDPPFGPTPVWGLILDTEYVYDLELRDDEVPEPSDGEVAQFELMPLDDVLRHVLDGRFMPESALVVIDYLIRSGFLHPENCDGIAELNALLHYRHPLPEASWTTPEAVTTDGTTASLSPPRA